MQVLLHRIKQKNLTTGLVKDFEFFVKDSRTKEEEKGKKRLTETAFLNLLIEEN